ncbi:MAG: 3-methyl-2-oxobutanoate hydroxymethyltransferase [Gammaproteobacteria bacterium]|nr:3-methyl-2-oxobutanoate hydroxymethyltransferase [Gammaproteobacteria bacterium]
MSARPDSSQHDRKKITVRSLHEKKQAGEKIVCLTAYDASFARILDQAEVDVVLVGDSLGMVVQGHETTLPVTVEDILYHSQMVANGLSHALMIVDMPFLSYTSIEAALENAGLFMKEAGAHMVKLEGGADQVDIVSALVQHGIPVCAHLGLQPQKVHKLGGYRVQGRETRAAEAMLEEARILEQAGADLLVLECVPNELAEMITRALSIPVIGIGASAACDGQILVLYDILGLSMGRVPKFSHNFLSEAGSIDGAVRAYVDAVKSGKFPGKNHVFS